MQSYIPTTRWSMMNSVQTIWHVSSKELTRQRCISLIDQSINTKIIGSTHQHIIERHISMDFYYIFNGAELAHNKTPITIFARNILIYDFEETEFEITGDLYEDKLIELGITTMPSYKIKFRFNTITCKSSYVELEKFISELYSPT